MGFLDVFLGKRKVAPPASADRLFALTTAYVDLETAHGVRTRGAAGLVFQQLETADFAAIVAETEQLLAGTGEETGTRIESRDDRYGYKWVIVRDDDVEDLVVSLNAVADNLSVGGYADRILAAVFAFEENGRPLYLIYNYKRGNWYPFVPAEGSGHSSPSGDGSERDNQREFRLRAQLSGAALPFEEEPGRWFPLWGIPF